MKINLLPIKILLIVSFVVEINTTKPSTRPYSIDEILSLSPLVFEDFINQSQYYSSLGKITNNEEIKYKLQNVAKELEEIAEIFAKESIYS